MASQGYDYEDRSRIYEELEASVDGLVADHLEIPIDCSYLFLDAEVNLRFRLVCLEDSDEHGTETGLSLMLAELSSEIDPSSSVGFDPCL